MVVEDFYTESMGRWATGAAAASMLLAPSINDDSIPKTDSRSVTAPQPNAKAAPEITKDEQLLALTIWGEARNLGEQGMAAIGHVIKNRVDLDKNTFGHGVKGVVWKNKQFSCWNKGDPNRTAMQEIGSLPRQSEDYKMWEEAKKIAVNVMQGSNDPTRGALLYHTTRVSPPWAKGIRPIAKIGSHLFYNKYAKVG